LRGRTSDDFIEAVRSAGDIVRLISEYVPLKQSGARYKGLCPFHQEKTPSFSVDPNTQLFYCFGCNTGGDAFKFVMLYEKVGFRESAEMLARRWGVPIPTRSPQDRQRNRLVEMNRAAETFYQERLADTVAGKRARGYLEKRGIGEETVNSLGIGYAPDSWEALRSHLLSKRFRPEEMLTGGLVLSRKDGRGEYDRFRDRLVFPIRDAGGRTLAFGGRTLGTAEPKYVNSPETPSYVKGNHLYGMDLAREAIRREGFAIVVEGYLDLAALLQAGFPNAVASLGTAFTPAQAQLLARYTDKVVVSYDGDAAGAAATKRSLDLLLGRGFQVRVADLPEGMDPDDFIGKEGSEEYGRRVRHAPGYLEFLIQREVGSREVNRTEELVAAVNAVLPHLARLPSAVERASWAAYMADALGVDDELVLQDLRTALRDGRPQMRQRATEPDAVREIEARLVSLLLSVEGASDRAGEELEPKDLEGTRVERIVRTILRLAGEGTGVDYPELFKALEQEEDRDLLTRIAFREEPEGELDEVDDCLRSLRRQRLMRERRALQREIERTADSDSLNSLLVRTQQLARQIDALS
jgi:DNA primase